MKHTICDKCGNEMDNSNESKITFWYKATLTTPTGIEYQSLQMMSWDYCTQCEEHVKNGLLEIFNKREV